MSATWTPSWKQEAVTDTTLQVATQTTVHSGWRTLKLVFDIIGYFSFAIAMYLLYTRYPTIKGFDRAMEVAAAMGSPLSYIGILFAHGKLKP